MQGVLKMLHLSGDSGYKLSIDKSPVYSIIYINKCADGKSTTRSPLFRELPSGARQSAFRAENHPGAACPTGANPCKQRRLQPLPCRALLEARERVCTARQREWYRRELDVTRSLSLEESRGQGLFLFRKLSPGEWIRSGTGIGATPCS